MFCTVNGNGRFALEFETADEMLAASILIENFDNWKEKVIQLQKKNKELTDDALLWKSLYESVKILNESTANSNERLLDSLNKEFERGNKLQERLTLLIVNNS